MFGGGGVGGGLSGTPLKFPWDERGQWKQWETGLHQTPPLKRGHSFMSSFRKSQGKTSMF